MGVRLSLAVALIALTACAEQTINEARAKSNFIIVACRTKLDTGELKTFTDVAKCREIPVIQAYKDAQYPYMDLIRIVMAAGDAAAERIDRREVSEAEAKLQLSELMTRVAAEERRRWAAGTARASPRELTAELLQGLPALEPANRPSTGLNCFQVASDTRCP
jgi:hypothetical protein